MLFDKGQNVLYMTQKNYGISICEYPKIGKGQFFSVNPYKKEAIKNLADRKEEKRKGRLEANPEKGIRGSESIEIIQAFSVEMDCISIPLQKEWVKAILGLPTVANHSGNKSIHCHFRLTESITKEQKEGLAFY